MVKICNMCGKEKDLQEFRTQTSHYKQQLKEYTRPYCKDCEAIEIRRKYLLDKINLTQAEQDELTKIHELYRLRLAKGLNTFGTRKSRSKGITAVLVDSQLDALKRTDADTNTEVTSNDT